MNEVKIYIYIWKKANSNKIGSVKSIHYFDKNRFEIVLEIFNIYGFINISWIQH